MLLVIDAGNTQINMGVYEGDELILVSRLATDRKATSDRLAIDISNIFRLNNVEPVSFEGSVISSVVPEITNALITAVKKLTGKDPVVIGAGVKTGLNILIDDPAGLGADLVASAVAAKNHYPLPCLVLDLGTATKVSAINSKGEFVGCSIAPGVTISLNALAKEASQLISISLKSPEHAIGTNTVDSMRSGIVFGTAGMIDSLCNRFEKELDAPIKSIVATGGLCDITDHCEHKILKNRDMILEGLKLIYEKNRKK